MKSYDLKDLKVLVIDPNKHARDLVKTILRELGVREFEAAEDGDAGFFALHQFFADVIFSEWLMAPTDGLAFTRKVRSTPGVPDPFVPIVMMTAQSEERHIIQARDAGVTEFLVKPLTVLSVYSRLCSIIERPRGFVDTGVYFGPDRRRRADPAYRGPKRREADKVAAAQAETDAIARKKTARKAAAEAAASAKAEEAARIKKEQEAKAEAPVDPSAMSQEELAEKLGDKD